MRLVQRTASVAIMLSLAAATPAVASSALSNLAPGPQTSRPSWLLSPEEIESTVRDTWGLTISNDEAQTFFGAVHTLMGGTSVVRRSTLLKEPHELYILTLDSLAAWLADKLTMKQLEVETISHRTEVYAFGGLTIGGVNVSDKISDPAQCQACYQDVTKAWCDCADAVSIGGLSAAGLTPEALASTAPGAGPWRKRLMHNIQDLGDFLMCGVGSIDDQTPIQYKGQKTHIAAYLLDDVFLSTWSAMQTTDSPRNAERRAWAAVLHSILVGQGCFLDMTSAQR